MTKIGYIVDSGSDVAPEIIEKYNIQVLPLSVTFKDGTYRDGVDITPQEVFARLTTEIPTTSLPNGQQIAAAFETLIKEGCTHIIGITISSALSGTFNGVRLVAEDYPEIATYILDTKSIGVGSGLFMAAATRYVDAGDDFETVVEKLSQSVSEGHVFFHIPTLEYLMKGGRIGKVSGTLGSLLKIQPIITCDEEGIYTTIAKFRASQSHSGDRAIHKLVEQMVRVGANKEQYLLGFSGGNDKAKARMQELQAEVDKALPNSAASYSVQLSSALGVHTGPDLLGCAILPLR